MPGSGTFRPWLPVAGTLAVLLAAGIAALAHLAGRRAGPSESWRTALSRFAAASPWRGCDLLAILLVLAGARLLRWLLPPTPVWDVPAFQGALLAGILWRLRGKRQAFGARIPGRTILGQALVRWLAILPVLWLASLVWQVLLNAFGHPPNFQLAVRFFLDLDRVWLRGLFILFAVILAPIAEEALFRGLLLPLLIRRVGAGAGMALAALGFALLHGDPGTLIALALFAVALSLAYVRTGTLLVPILMHAFFNGANLILLATLARAGAL